MLDSRTDEHRDSALAGLDAGFELVFDHAPVGMMIVDFGDPAPGAIVRGNNALARLLGLTRDELVGRTLVDLAHPSERAEVRDRIERIRAGSREQVEVERRYQTASGEEVPVLVTAAHLPEAQGLLGLAHVQDLRERKRAEAAREEARIEHENLLETLHQFQRLETVGQLAGGIAHDFNNLLAVIIHSAAFARADLGDHPAARELAEIEAAAQRAVEMTRQLLMLGRQETSKPEPVELGAFFERLGPAIVAAAGPRVAVDVSAAPRLLVEVDPRQLERALLNVATNAGEAMPDGGELHVRAGIAAADPSRVRAGRTSDRYVQISLRDTGPGMTEEVRRHAADPFFTTKPPGSGPGLGLTTAFGMVVQNHGDLEIVSEPGEGTDVRVLLPLVEAAPAAEAEPAPPAHGARVLVVEDEPGLRRVAQRILSAAGYEVDIVADGDEALAFAADADVVVTDLVMPGLSGDALGERLRADQPELPVIFMSGYTDRPGRLPEGAHFLGKPFTREALLDVVSLALAGRS